MYPDIAKGLLEGAKLPWWRTFVVKPFSLPQACNPTLTRLLAADTYAPFFLQKEIIWSRFFESPFRLDIPSSFLSPNSLILSSFFKKLIIALCLLLKSILGALALTSIRLLFTVPLVFVFLRPHFCLDAASTFFFPPKHLMYLVILTKLLAFFPSHLIIMFL